MRITFTGDLSFTGYFQGKESSKILSHDVKAFLKRSQCTVINLESPITDCETTEKARLAHKCDKAAINFLRKNFNYPVITLANNHIMDYGVEGLYDTMEALDDAQIARTGAGKDLKEAIRPVIVKSGNLGVAILSVEYKKEIRATAKGPGVLHESYDRLIRKQIKRLKKYVNMVIVVYHGGEEFLHTPMPYTRGHLHQYIDIGADAVVAHHPHTVQGYEKYHGKYIFYSLGNFIFDTDYQRVQDDSEDGMILCMDIDEDSMSMGLEFCPIRINRETQMIEVRDDDDYFVNLADIQYADFWPSEAARKQKVLEKCNAIEPDAVKKSSFMNKLAEAIMDPMEAKRKAKKKKCLEEGRKIAAGK